MRQLTMSALLALATASATPAIDAAAQTAREQIVVSSDWLAGHLKDADLVVLHVGPAEGYATEHIPGSRQAMLAAITAPETEGGLSVEFPSDEVLDGQLEALGIGDRSRVVVAAAGRYGTSALRVLSTLYYAGLGDRAMLLDGGVDAWKAAGHPLTAEDTPVRRGQLTLKPVASFRVDAEFVASHAGKPGYAVVDARGQAYYDGVQNSRFSRDDTGKPGHVPGSLSLAMQDMWDDQGRLKPTDELRQLFATAGVKPGDVVVAYCHIGIFANTVLTAARILGHDIRLYDGSFQDWVARDRPLTTSKSSDK